MQDPLDYQNRPLFDRLHRTKILTCAVLVWEECVKRAWRLVFWCTFFTGFWLLKIPGLFENIGYIATNIIFLLGLAYFIFRDVRHFSWPKQSHIHRRIEQASALKHRPLSAIDDKLFDQQKARTRDLWGARMPIILDALKKLRIPLPQPLLAGRDPRALRFAAVLFLLAGFWVAGPEWSERLHHGLMPYGWVEQSADVPDILATISPPEYTRIDQTIIQASYGAQHEMDIPQGSMLQIKMMSRFGRPVLKADGYELPFEDIGNQNYAVEIEVPAGRHLQVKQLFGSAFTLDYTLTPDTPPSVSMQEEAEVNALPDAQIQVPLSVYDDYGVENITLSMQLDPMVTQAPLGYPKQETRSVMSPASQDFKLSPVYDFTANPWAGLPVVLDIEVSDLLGQTTKMESISFILPEREFKHPVAKELIGLRKRLGWNPQSEIVPVSDDLLDILAYPDDYHNDLVVFLALRSAASRLLYAYEKIDLENPAADQNHADTRSVMSLLWDTALRIEDGNLSLAARNLRQAQMALESALQNENMSAEDIAKLMNNLKQAMAEYLTELSKELQKRMAEGEDVPMMSPEALAQMIDPEALSNFIEQMENEMLSGNKRQAQDMLSQLQRMLDMLNPNMAAPMPSDMMAMIEGVSELEQLIDKQENLRDQTAEQADEMDELTVERSFGDLLNPNLEMFEKWGLGDMPPPPSDKQSYTLPGVDTQANKAEQESLRYILGQLMLDADQELENIPEKMGMAEQEMRQSSQYLGLNNPQSSLPHQELAIEYLKDAQEELSEQLQQRMQEMMGQGEPMLSQGNPQQYDPLGRPYGAGPEEGNRPFSPNSQVKIPDEAERKRVQEILRILREKSGDFTRSKEELEYFRRLLKQF